jgi:hypothetical protein
MKKYDDMKNTSVPHPELPLQESAPKFLVMLCRDGSGNAYEVRYYHEDVLQQFLQKVDGATRTLKTMIANEVTNDA